MFARLVLCLVIGAGAMNAAAGDGEKGFGPPADGRWVVLKEMTDEFEGDKLDAARWHDSNPTWKGRQPAFFARHNVTVSDGKLHLTMRREDLKDLPKGYHTFTSAAVKSRTTVRYGYFEIKCRPMNSRGSSAFWFYDQTPEVWTEIDVFEMGAGAPSHEHTVHMNAHVFHTLTNPDRHWSKGGKWQAPWRLADGYHVYALEWNAKELKYYVDGAVVRTMENTHWHQPLCLNFDSETMPQWFGLPDAGTLPSTFSIEYVRAWKRQDDPGEGTIKACEFHLTDKPPESPKGKPARLRLGTDGKGELVVVAVPGESERPQRVHLEYDDEEFFRSQKAPQIRKTVTLRDGRGREVRLTFQWSRPQPPKPGAAYTADSVQIAPAVKPATDADAMYEFHPTQGGRVRMKLLY